MRYVCFCLQFCVCADAAQVFQQLLQAGADSSVQDADGKTAAQLAPKDWAS
jgi:ankyrin repeat protein